MMDYSKRIVVSTWYGPANYGTALQALALKRFLELKGHRVQYIDDKREKSANIIRPEHKSKLNKLCKIATWYRLPYRKDIRQKAIMQAAYMEQYCDRYEIRDDRDITRINQETDLFITGGDQVWNPYVIEDVHFLTFVDTGIPKVSYGTSVGVNQIPKEFQKKYANCLNAYTAISVREATSKRVLEEFLDLPIEIVVDPTLLLDAADWGFLSDTAKLDDVSGKPYILCYFVGHKKEYWNYVEKLKKNTGYRVIVLPINDFAYVNLYEKYVKTSPAEFLALIKNAKIVCTDSFHATLFSIQYEREFYVLKRFEDTSSESQNSRLVDF